MDDYDYDDYDVDDGWLYAEDEFDLADELAENAIAEPGYAGTNFDIAMESYEFELFAFWDDLEYADDAYWDYGLLGKAGVKRKRDSPKKAGTTDKRRRTQVTYDREDDPLLFVSREQRTNAFFEPAPLLEETAVKYTFLADWRDRYANEDGLIENKAMPVDMQRAAEVERMETMDETFEEGIEEQEEDEEEWEDDDGEDGDEGGEEDDGPGLNPDMLKEILKQKLGEVGLEGEDESAFMQVLAKMMSGEGDADDAAGDLTKTLLGKLTSNPASDSGLASWLSREGVELEEGGDDDASSVATVDLPEGLRHSGLATRQSAQDSPIDSVMGSEAQQRNSTRMPLHSGSPTSSAKKRTATAMQKRDEPNKKRKKVTFDVPPSSSSDSQVQNASSEGVADLPTSEDPLMSEATLKRRPMRPQSTTDSISKDHAPTKIEQETPAKTTSRPTRKRKTADAELTEENSPEKKPTRKRKEVDMHETTSAASPMGPPAKRTRAAKAKAGK